jgi:predicted  nucleic acid-binding Zn-ribbon protein
MYVGFLGHFSSGKSSTINSLLKNIDIPYQRLTGLHPTDRAVTLITHPSHSSDLIGTHKRGDLEVGSSLVDNDLLKQRVVVDTPGSGDPSVIEEMVRDFLPICDRLVYVLCAAIPLDRTDLPILEKTKRDLPFIPMTFVVTRADEFRRDLVRPLSEENFDRAKADMFVSELISRLANAVVGLSITQEDVLLVDNITDFNTDKLADFVFSAPDVKHDTGTTIHTHKIAYYARSGKIIRDFFMSYLKDKIAALDMLLTTARNNHSHYQEKVTMANSRLTESWIDKQRVLATKRTGQTEWVRDLETCNDLPSSISGATPLMQGMAQLRKTIEFWADSAALNVCRSLKGKLSAQLHWHMSSLYDQVVRSKEPDSVPLHPFIIDNPRKAGLLDHAVEVPLAVASDIRQIPDSTTRFLRDCAAHIAESGRRLDDSLSDRRLVITMEKTLEESIQQLRGMLDDFFQSVQVYRSGILSLNARELAEKAGIVQAIEEVEKAEIPEDKRKSWLTLTVERIFPERMVILERCDKKLDEIHDKLTPVHNEAKRLRTIETPMNLGPNVEDALALSRPGRDNQLLQVVQSAIDNFNETCSSLFERLNDERESLLNERRDALKQRIKTVMRRRLRRLCRYAAFGSVVGLLTYLAFFFWKEPFQQNWTTVVFVGVLANGFFAFLLWLIGWITDKSKTEIEEQNTQHVAVSREITEELLKSNKDIRDWVFIDNLRSTIKAVISGQWTSAAEDIVKQNVTQPFEKPYERLKSISSVLETARNEYIAAADELTSSLTACYQRSDDNLKALEEVSAGIRQQAIEPSFSMLQECSDQLRRALEDLQAVEFSW